MFPKGPYRDASTSLHARLAELQAKWDLDAALVQPDAMHAVSARLVRISAGRVTAGTFGLMLAYLLYAWIVPPPVRPPVEGHGCGLAFAVALIAMPFFVLPTFATVLLIKWIGVAIGRRRAHWRVRALMDGPDPTRTEVNQRLEYLSRVTPQSALASAGRRLETTSLLWHLASSNWAAFCLSVAVSHQFLLGRHERGAAGHTLALMVLLGSIHWAVIKVTMWSLRAGERSTIWAPAVCCVLITLVIVVMGNASAGLAALLITVSLVLLSWRAFSLRERILKERAAL